MSAPPRKFWQPLPLWLVLVIFFLAQLVAVLAVVALRLPIWIGSGVGGVAGVVVVGVLAARRAARP